MTETVTIPAENLRAGDTVVKRFANATWTWIVQSVTVKGNSNTAVGVRSEDGEAFGYSRREPVTIQARESA